MGLVLSLPSSPAVPFLLGKIVSAFFSDRQATSCAPRRTHACPVSAHRYLVPLCSSLSVTLCSRMSSEVKVVHVLSRKTQCMSAKHDQDTGSARNWSRTLLACPSGVG
eukprot:4593708-Pleurochrysis_carterae.AAC.9